MHPTTSLCLIKLSPWITTSGRKRTAKGNLAITRPTRISLTRSIILMREMEVTVLIALEDTSIGEMATTIMAIGSMVTTGTITQVETAMVITTAIAMDLIMGTMDSRAPTLRARRTYQRLLATGAGRLDITPITAQKRKLRMLPSPILSRKDM